MAIPSIHERQAAKAANAEAAEASNEVPMVVEVAESNSGKLPTLYAESVKVATEAGIQEVIDNVCDRKSWLSTKNCSCVYRDLS